MRAWKSAVWAWAFSFPALLIDSPPLAEVVAPTATATGLATPGKTEADSGIWQDIRNQPETPQQLLSKARGFMLRAIQPGGSARVDSIEAEIVGRWKGKAKPIVFFPEERLLAEFILHRHNRLLDSVWMNTPDVIEITGKFAPTQDDFSDSLKNRFLTNHAGIRSAIMSSQKLSGYQRDWLLLLADHLKDNYSSGADHESTRRLWAFAQKYPRHPMSSFFKYQTPIVGDYSSMAWGGELALGYGHPSEPLATYFGRGFSGVFGLYGAYGPAQLRLEFAPTGATTLAASQHAGQWKKGSRTHLMFINAILGYELEPLGRWGAVLWGGANFSSLTQDTIPKKIVDKDPSASSGSRIHSGVRPMLGGQILWRVSDFSQPKLPAHLPQWNGALTAALRWYGSPFETQSRELAGDYWQWHVGLSIWRRGLL